MSPSRPRVRFQAGFSKARESLRTITYFMVVQGFFLLMLACFSFSQEIFFGVAAAIPPLMGVMTRTRKSYLFVFYFICITFVLGQRTMYIGENVRIVPGELLIWILALMSMALKRKFVFKNAAVPIALTLLIVGSVYGIVITKTVSSPYKISSDMNMAFAYAKGLWLALPAFIMCRQLLLRLEDVQAVVTLLAIECLFLSVLSIAEYYNLGFMKHFAGDIITKSIKNETEAGGHFRRLQSIFWGGPSLVFMMNLFFPLILAQWFNAKTMTQKIILGAAIVFTLCVIYLAGHRGVWVSWFFGLVVYFLLKGAKGIVALIIVVVVGMQFVPGIALNRFNTLYGNKQDSSAKIRIARAQTTWDMISKSPIVGYGWGSSGLVHSDILQTWADGGILTIAAFLALYATVLRAIYKASQMTKNKMLREYAYGFAGGLASFFVIFCTQALYNLPQQYPPFWMIMGMAYHLPNVIFIEKQIAAAQEKEINNEKTATP